MTELLRQPLFHAVWMIVACAMEFWSMWVHEKIWHHTFWWGHKSHHEQREGWFERNDIFALAHACLAMMLIVIGLEFTSGMTRTIAVGFGCGMSVFGIAYFMIHDGFIHGRLPVQFLARARFFRRIRIAHMHHHHTEHQPPFGLFLGPWELRRKSLKKKDASVGV